MYIKEIWRYPVKSMAGEQLQGAKLTQLGIDGDRILQVYNRSGRVITSRTHPGLLGLHAKLDDARNLRINGLAWNDPTVEARIVEIGGPGAQLHRDETADRFDILPLLVATDGSIDAFGRDHRRLRPNIVIGGVEGLDEREWQGGQLVVSTPGGEIVIGIHDLRGRCVMTTYDPDTLQQDPAVLRDIVRRFGGKLALNCEVLQGGELQVGQEVRVVKQA